MSFTTRPGWYPDPEGGRQLRFWDGAQWTPYSAPIGQPWDYPAQMVSPPRPPWYRRWWAVTLVMLLGIPVLLLGLVAFATLVSEPMSNEPGATSAQEERLREDPASYRTVTPREYALIVKDPKAHVGERIVVHGVVTQFDAATGTDSFLADTAARQSRDWFDYKVNTMVVTNDPSILTDVVEDDLVKMHVEVMGSTSYDTQIGGNTTVPELLVSIIEVTGRAR
jgi:hypothetical protein